MDFQGQALLAMDHDFFEDAFPQPEFLDHLEREEVSAGALRGELGMLVRERYARSLKCLIRVGPGRGGDVHRRRLGQRIEIVLLQNPHELDAGARLEAQVWFDGKPLSGQLVRAYRADSKGGGDESRTRTDARGIAGFDLERPGVWLIRLVRIQPSPDPSLADWESYWASFCFELD